jgi:hypothetical protein
VKEKYRHKFSSQEGLWIDFLSGFTQTCKANTGLVSNGRNHVLKLEKLKRIQLHGAETFFRS